jgi:hypothetical protein
MPDFDKLLNPIIKESKTSLPEINIQESKRYASIQFPDYDNNIVSGTPNNEDLESKAQLFASMPSDKQKGIPVGFSELEANKRYDAYNPLLKSNEDFAAYGQGWGSKMVNGVSKGLLLTGTTFVQGTVGLVNGLIQWGKDGRFASFYDNDFNRGIDEILKEAEDNAPNFYTDVEKNAKWYSPDYFMTGNFLWDGVVKNMGFAAGAYLTGGVYSAGLKGLANLPGAARLLSMGRLKEAVAASEEALVTLDKGSEAYGKIKALSDGYLKTYNVLDKGHRVVVAGLSTSGEAGFEAFQHLNSFRNQKIQEYKDKNNGLFPEGAALEKINRDADSIGNATFLGNVALLSATNYIQFPKILGSSYKAEKSIINNVTSEIGGITTDAAGKYVAKVPKSKVLNALNKIRPYTFSASEGFEEGAQFSIGVGVEDYYNKKYNNEATSWLDAISTGITEGILSDEGAKNVLIGGLSGAIMMGKSRFQEAKQISTATQEAVKQFNQYQLSDFTKETKDSVNRGTVLQEEREQFLKDGNITESKDKETDYIINYLTPRIKFGRFDLVKAEINDYRILASTNEGFNQLVKEGKALSTDNKESFLKRLNNFEQTADNVKSLYQSLNLRYGGQKDEKGNPLYTSAVIDKMLYASTKISDYEKRIPSLTSQLIGSVNNITEILQDVSDGKLDTLNIAIDNLEASKIVNKEELIEALDDASYMTAKRDLFLKQYDSLKKFPEKYFEKTPFVTSIDNNILDEKGNIIPKETIKIKTKKGERDIEIGTEYFLGRVIDYTKQGTEVFRAPIIQVLSKNEDGTIKIKDVKTGDVFDVSEETIEEYSLGKVSSANPKGLFVLNNWNKIYQHKGIKVNNKPALGRIEYSDRENSLVFVYKNDKGKVVRTFVRTSQFVAQGDYKKGMITVVGKYTPKEEKALIDLLGYKEKISDSEIVIRNQFLAKLYEDGINRIQEIEKSLNSKKEEIEKISKKIENLTLTKTGAPRKRITSTLRQQIDSLAKLRTSLEKQLEAEQNEKEELEYTVPFFKDMIEELSEFPEDNSAFIDKLKSDVNLLEDLINITDKSIDDTKKLIEHIDELLNNALSVFNNYIKSLKEKNPNIPLGIEQLEANLEKFFGEEGIKQFIEQRQGFTAKVLELEADINDFENELKIPELSKKAESLIEDLNELSEGIDKLIGEQLTKKNVLEKFQKFVDERKQIEEEEAALSTNKKFKEQAFKTEDKSTVQTKYTNPNYEPNKKKQTNILRNSTVGIDRGKPHQTRAKIFGANLPKYKDVYSVYVSENNEAAYGLEGLTDLIRTDDGVINESIASDKILTLVMVNGNRQLIGVDGKPLTEEQLADAKNHAIFQVKPDPEFTWKSEKYGKGEDASMFRKGTPENLKKAIIEKYAKEKAELLKETGKGAMHTVAASWGIPEFELTEEGEINYEAKNSVESSGLIDKTTDKGNNSLEAKQLITVPTVNEIESQGLTSYTDALGKPFLVKDNAVVPLINKKHTQQEAESIYDALLGLSKAAMSGKQGIRDPKAVRILNFLRGVVYWGVPRNATGYNSIFFDTNPDTGKLMLTISNKGYDVVFTPTELERNRGEVIDKIKELHNNINSTLVKKTNNKFEQIISISSEGEVNSIMWPNYQSYLLADHLPDADGKITTKGKKRSSEDIPLTTPMRKVKNNDDVNRHSIYFYTTDTLDDYTFEELKQAKKEVTAKKMAPGQLSASQKEYLLDGETPNEFKTPSGKQLYFISPSNVTSDNYLSEIKLDTLPETMNGFAEIEISLNPEMSKEEAIQRVVRNLKTAIFNSINEFKKPASRTPSCFCRRRRSFYA